MSKEWLSEKVGGSVLGGKSSTGDCFYAADIMLRSAVSAVHTNVYEMLLTTHATGKTCTMNIWQCTACLYVVNNLAMDHRLDCNSAATSCINVAAPS